MKLTLTILLILTLSLFAMNNVVQCQITPSSSDTGLPIITMFSAPEVYPFIEAIVFDLNTGKMYNYSTDVEGYVEYIGVLGGNSEYFDTFYTNLTGNDNYYTGRFFFANKSLTPIEELPNTYFQTFEFLMVPNYYDKAANILITAGLSEVSPNNTIVVYDLSNNGDITYIFTDSIPLANTLPGFTTYLENQVLLFYYDSNGVGMAPTLMVYDLSTNTSVTYLIDQFDYLNSVTATSPIPLYINGQIYLYAAASYGYNYLFKVILGTDTAKVKLLYKNESFDTFASQMFITQDQQNIVFIGGKYVTSSKNFLFTLYNLETETVSQTIEIENFLEETASDYLLYYAL
ncbi:hypothetical protein DLAC_11292 [Tieghemostelium lacteum]|uniref:Uncharacterized protein n=1 Tax=Tieghemostelium lacteum TaxID=361077 RepID=A0A151Z3N5_TIELA|nr:hypothetical protein DLAC_11292 [Tieghemostelium lacteum]|eukprot:KYQ88561.1 hypothetical protein DLAC_11292 [Tieghemostelium lacteum]